MPVERFPDAVRNGLGFLLTEYGFRIVEEDDHYVMFEASDLCAEAAWDPRGEVDVRVFRRGTRDYGVWEYTGMVGRASVPRLLEIAGERMQADTRVLLGDRAYYDQLAADQKRKAEEWTAYYSGSGPRPARQEPLP
jgi:hypothetical protein